MQACSFNLGSTGPTRIDNTRRAPDEAWIAPDKFRHFFASYTVTSLGYASLRYAGLSHDASLTMGVVAGGLAGVIKEVADVRAGRGASIGDLVWDAIGIAGAVLVLRFAH